MESDSSKLDARKDPNPPSVCRDSPNPTLEAGTSADSPNRAPCVDDGLAMSSTALPKAACTTVDRPAKDGDVEPTPWKACQDELDAKARALILVLDTAMLYLVS